MMQARHSHDRCSSRAETPPPEPNKSEVQKRISPLVIPGTLEFNLKTGNRSFFQTSLDYAEISRIFLEKIAVS